MRLIDRESLLKKVIRLSAYALLIAATALLLLSVVMRIDWVEELRWYKEYQLFLEQLRYRVETLENKWLILVALESLFLIKSFVPLAPVSLLCLISAAVFPLHWALLIDIGGLVLLFSVRYLLGYWRGGDKLLKQLERYEFTRRALAHDVADNPGLLFVFRFVPVFPTNRISGVYGAKKYDYAKFLLFSLLGFAPRLVSYSLAGNRVLVSFSWSFLSPLIVIFTISGISMLAINEILEYTAEKAAQKKE